MAELTVAQLKDRFSSGDRPTQQDFHDLIDTLAAMPSLTGATVGMAPVGPASGDLSGQYPGPTVRAGAIEANHFDPTAAALVAPGGSVQDVAIAVYQGNTKSFVYRNWFSLPGLVGTEGSTPTPPSGGGTTPPEGTVTTGTVRLFNTGWLPFPAAYGEVDGLPKTYDFDIGDFSFIPANFWGEATCDPADTYSDATYVPFPSDSIVPLSYFFSRLPEAVTDADILTPLFALSLVNNHLKLSIRIPFTGSVPVVQTENLAPNADVVQNPATRLSVIPINLANWRFRVKAIHVNT